MNTAALDLQPFAKCDLERGRRQLQGFDQDGRDEAQFLLSRLDANNE